AAAASGGFAAAAAASGSFAAAAAEPPPKRARATAYGGVASPQPAPELAERLRAAHAAAERDTSLYAVTEHCAAGLRGSTCAVCDQDDAVNTTLVPCGHACVCQPCALALRAAKRDTCPLCAAKILYVTPLYVSGGD